MSWLVLGLLSSWLPYITKALTFHFLLSCFLLCFLVVHLALCQTLFNWDFKPGKGFGYEVKMSRWGGFFCFCFCFNLKFCLKKEKVFLVCRYSNQMIPLLPWWNCGQHLSVFYVLLSICALFMMQKGEHLLMWASAQSSSMCPLPNLHPPPGLPRDPPPHPDPLTFFLFLLIRWYWYSPILHFKHAVHELWGFLFFLGGGGVASSCSENGQSVSLRWCVKVVRQNALNLYSAGNLPALIFNA